VVGAAVLERVCVEDEDEAGRAWEADAAAACPGREAEDAVLALAGRDWEACVLAGEACAGRVCEDAGEDACETGVACGTVAALEEEVEAGEEVFFMGGASSFCFGAPLV
jgi:hypothetical protein